MSVGYREREKTTSPKNWSLATGSSNPARLAFRHRHWLRQSGANGRSPSVLSCYVLKSNERPFLGWRKSLIEYGVELVKSRFSRRLPVRIRDACRVIHLFY